MTISQAFEAFEIDELLSEGRSQKTIDAYHVTRNSFLRAVGADLDVSFIQYGHVIEWKRQMYERANSGAHMALQLREFRRLLAYLKQHGFETLAADEIKIPKFTYRKTDWLTVEEVGRFLSVIRSKRDKALFGALFSSGARISELLSLDRGDIRGSTALIVGKGRVPGELHFDTNAILLIDDYLQTREDDCAPMFLSIQKQRMKVQTCIYFARKYAQLAGIDKRVTTHVFRHSYATNFEQNGLDINGIRRQMRHKKLETTRIYMHGDDLRKQPDYDEFHTPVPLD